MLLSIVSILIVFSLLVYVHEIGHFIAARWAGIRVDEFGFGFPPQLAVLFRRGDTKYTLNAIPIGGFVRMAGMPGDEDPTDPDGFNSKSRTRRVVALVTGSAMNMLLAVVLFAAVSLVGEPVDVDQLRVVQVVGQSPAYKAGISYGDIIIRMDGQPVYNLSQLGRSLERFAGQPVSITVNRAGREVNLVVVPRANPPKGEGAMGVSVESKWMRTDTVKYPWWQAVPRGFSRAWETLADIYSGIMGTVQSLFEPAEETPMPLTGPVGLTLIVSEVAQSGHQDLAVRLAVLTAMLSINLGLINLFPFPALDGGRLLFILLEWLRGGRKLDPRREGYVHLIGIALILGVFVVVSYFDLARWAVR